MTANEKISLEATAENLRASIACHESAPDRSPAHDLSTAAERSRLAEIESALAPVSAKSAALKT